jgi:hypothetical protein
MARKRKQTTVVVVKRRNEMNKIACVFLLNILLGYVSNSFAVSDSSWVILSGSNCKSAISQRYHKFIKNDKIEIYSLNDSICKSIERNLPAYFESLNKSNTNSHNCDYYKRQYIGFTLNGNQYVYINLFAKHNKFERWKKSAICVKDGGDSFCGIIYDLKADKFIEIACNGEA